MDSQMTVFHVSKLYATKLFLLLYIDILHSKLIDSKSMTAEFHEFYGQKIQHLSINTKLDINLLSCTEHCFNVSQFIKLIQ